MIINISRPAGIYKQPNRFRLEGLPKIKNDINPTSFNGDSYFPNRYWCSTIMPNDVIFYKNKRMIEDTITLKNELKLDELNIKKICKDNNI